jgi:GTPase SAR1 family protein
MAGSGKSTLMAQLQRSLENDNGTAEPARKGYCLNLDPATLAVPFGASIDIRDTIDYKQVMKQHNLGPNGAIMTSLNLFATKFDQVLGILEKRCDDLDYILVDTPGQIEAFTWSASGSIMSESLASAFPTVLVFVVDTVRCASSPNTFMSNMLYACSMLYRTRLPLVVVFNKIDVVPHDFCVEWMQDYEAFQDALDEMQSNDTSAGFYGSLTRSLSLVLDEFYRNLHTCGVSAATGDGMDEFWKSVDAAAKDFETDYIEDLKLRMREQIARKNAIARLSMEKLNRDIENETR